MLWKRERSAPVAISPRRLLSVSRRLTRRMLCVGRGDEVLSRQLHVKECWDDVDHGPSTMPDALRFRVRQLFFDTVTVSRRDQRFRLFLEDFVLVPDLVTLPVDLTYIYSDRIGEHDVM